MAHIEVHYLVIVGVALAFKPQAQKLLHFRNVFISGLEIA